MKIYQVDSFTTEPFKGNPAGVHLLKEEISVQFMQNIALEMNLSETAFALQLAPNHYKIKFYTPTVEIDLCGHATLATAHILYELGEVDADQSLTFQSNVGPLTITKTDSWINMDFPSVSFEATPFTTAMENAINTKIIGAYAGNGWQMLEVGNVDDLQGITANAQTFIDAGLGHSIITCAGDDDFDFYYRCFVPQSGILEDPVTGSAQTILIHFWHSKTAKHNFVSKQVSTRTGVLKGTYLGERTLVSGQAITIFSSDWKI